MYVPSFLVRYQSLVPAEDYSDRYSDRRLCSDRPDPIGIQQRILFIVVTIAQLSELREVRILYTFREKMNNRKLALLYSCDISLTVIYTGHPTIYTALSHLHINTLTTRHLYDFSPSHSLLLHQTLSTQVQLLNTVPLPSTDSASLTLIHSNPCTTCTYIYPCPIYIYQSINQSINQYQY